MQAYRLVILSAIAFVMSFNISAQNIGIGQWRTHLPYQKVIDVDVWGGSKTYAATPFDLFVYDETDNSISLLNKVNGLSDIGVSAIEYNEDYEVLLVAYSNTNVDLIHADGISNISDIKDKELIGNKTINDILFIDKYAYLSCGFGIVVLDIEREEVYDTYLIGNEGDYINVLDIAFFDNKLFAATEAGVYYAPLIAQI